MTPPLMDRLPILTEVISPGGDATADAVQSGHPSGPHAQGAVPSAGAGSEASPPASRTPVAAHAARAIPTDTADHFQTRRMAVQADLLKRVEDEIAERLGRTLEAHVQALLQRHVDAWARELASELQPSLREEIQGVMAEILTQGPNPAP